MKYDLGIVGGLGPLATCYFYKLITEKTKVTCDQDHLNIIILSDTSTPDRTEYILDHTKPSPYPNLLRDCQILESHNVDLICIPCNTSTYFIDELRKNIHPPISNMIENTVLYIAQNNYQKVCLLATTGTINSKLYQKYFDKYNISYVLPNQEKVMEIIYDYVKKGEHVPQDLFKEATLVDADAYVLGCTELSILKEQFSLDNHFIDPLEVEADLILKRFHKEMK